MKITELVFRKDFPSPDYIVKLSDFPDNLLPDDIINIYRSEGSDVEDGYTSISVNRLREETEEEKSKRKKEYQTFKEESRAKRYEIYLKLRKEFEEDIILKRGMSTSCFHPLDTYGKLTLDENIDLEHKNYFVIDYHDFDKLVQEHVPNCENFECVADFQMYNDTTKTINNVTKSNEDIEIDEYSSAYSYIQFLCNKNILPEGNYLIKASW